MYGEISDKTMSHNINGKRIASNTIALYVRTFITMLIAFFTTRITLAQLGSDDFGLNNLVGGVVAMFGFLNASMGTAVQRFYSIEIGKKNEKELSKVFSTGLYLHILVALITVVLAEIFAIFFLSKLNIPSERLLAAHIVFQVSIASFALNIINVPYAALLRAREMFTETAKIDILQSILRLGVLYFLTILSWDKLILLSFLNFSVTIIYLFLITRLALKFPECRHWPRKNSVYLKKMMNFVSLLLLASIAQVVRDKGLLLLINVFFGLTANAAYAIALQVLSMLNNFISSFKQSVIPQIMSLWGSHSVDEMKKLVDSGTKITNLLLMIIALPIIAESDYLLKLWLGNSPENSGVLVSLILVDIIVCSYHFYYAQSVNATGKIRIMQLSFAFIYVASIAVMYGCFKLGANIYWAMYVNIAASILIVTVSILCSHINYGYSIRHFLSKILLPGLLCTGFIFIVLKGITIYMEPSFVRLLLVILSSILLTGILGYYIICNKTEQQLVVKYIKKLINKNEI